MGGLEGVSYCKSYPSGVLKITAVRVKLRSMKRTFDTTFEIAFAVQQAYKGPMVLQDRGGWYIMK